MKINYANINSGDYDAFHNLMTGYYRDGEDKDTPQEEIDDFIKLLFDLITSGKICGCFANAGNSIAGFVLWMKDTEQSEFCEMPGYGTILEIGIDKKYRKLGIGKAMVDFAEKRMISNNISGLYLSAYGPALDFWKKCGYKDSERIASNGLPILTKDIP